MNAARARLVYVGLGSNLGDRGRSLMAALDRIARIPETALLRVSSFYETDPVGPVPQGKFLNAACEAESGLSPQAFLAHLQGIEKQLGRDRAREVRWGPRSIDLDLLLWGDLVLDSGPLVIPHPRMLERAFVLAPLTELAPTLVHPILKERVSKILARLGRSGTLKRPRAKETSP